MHKAICSATNCSNDVVIEVNGDLLCAHCAKHEVEPAQLVHAQAMVADRMFINHLVSTMTPEELERFCFENGFTPN